MAKSVDWYYHRKNCTTCKRMDALLEDQGVTAKEIVDARKTRFGTDEALEIAKQANKILVAKGQKVVTFDMKKNPPDDETLLAHLMGPSGNLRAPAVRRGKTLLIGFNGDEFAPQLA